MKKIIALILIAGTSAFAANKGYDLRMNLTVDGKLVSAPQMIVEEGKTATVTQKNESGDESFIEVTASEGSVKNNNGILMKFTIGVVQKNGERKIISQPQILAKENKKAEITVGSNAGTKDMSLTVVATRKTF